MGVVLLLVLLALVIGAVGLVIKALKWLLILSLVFLLVGAFSGFRARSRL